MATTLLNKIYMGVWNQLIILTIFVLAMKLGWQVVDQPQLPIKVDVMDDLQSLWEVEAINSSKPFQYHLEIDN